MEAETAGVEPQPICRKAPMPFAGDRATVEARRSEVPATKLDLKREFKELYSRGPSPG